MNKVMFLGRLTKDPEVRYSGENGDFAIAKFSIAVARRGKDKDGRYLSDFFEVTAFGKLGEFVQNWLHKGSKIIMEGRIENHNYTNKEGRKVYADQIVAEGIEFAESKSAESSNAGNGNGSGFDNAPDTVSDAELIFN